LIAEASGIETGFIILDEIFGSQDLQRKGLIIQALNNLSKKFRQIILITHVEDIKDSVENIIEIVENEEGISKVKTI
jgi:exonuclease SbcC